MCICIYCNSRITHIIIIDMDNETRVKTMVYDHSIITQVLK